MILRSCIAAASLLALAACGKSGDTAKGNETAPAASATAGSGVTIQPGQWEVVTETVKYEAPNMPKEAAAMMAGRKETDMNCITAEEVRQSSGNLFAGKKDKNCSKQEFTIAGGRVRGRMTCGGGGVPGQMDIEMDGTYTATTYAMTTKMRMSSAAGAMNIESVTNGRRIGECPAGESGKEG